MDGPKQVGAGHEGPYQHGNRSHNWAETLSVCGLAGQVQQELDAVAATISAAKHMKSTDMRAVRIAIRRASVVAAEVTCRAERVENTNRPAREVVFRQGRWEITSHKLASEVQALTDQAHSLGECLHVRKRELEFLCGKYASLETRASRKGVDVTDSEALSFHSSVPLPTRAELLPSCLPPWTDAGAPTIVIGGGARALVGREVRPSCRGRRLSAARPPEGRRGRRREASPPPPSPDTPSLGAGAIAAEQPWDALLHRMGELERRVDARLLAL